MQSYRLYFMDRKSGHISQFETIEAAADADAIKVAEAKTGYQPMELWRNGIKLRHFDGLALDFSARPAAQGQQSLGR